MKTKPRRECRSVFTYEEALAEVLGEPVFLNERVEHQSPKGLGEHLFELLAPQRHRDEVAAGQQQAVGGEGVHVGIPLELAPEGLQRGHHPGEAV